MTKLWNWVKTYLWKFIGGLFLDEKQGAQVISLGRVLVILTFAWMAHCWTKGDPALPGGLQETFYVLLGYVFGSKAVQTAQTWLGTKGPAINGMPSGYLKDSEAPANEKPA